MISALMAFSRFELELFFKTFIAVLFTYVAPSMIFGFYVFSAPANKRAAAVAAMYPLMLGVIIVFVSLYTLATQVVGYREMGFYKRISLDWQFCLWRGGFSLALSQPIAFCKASLQLFLPVAVFFSSG
jgi:hypothetical protein